MKYKINYITEDNSEQHLIDLETTIPLQVGEVLLLPDLGGENAVYTVEMVGRKVSTQEEFTAFVIPLPPTTPTVEIN